MLGIRRLVACCLAVAATSLGAPATFAAGAETVAAGPAEPMPWTALSRFGGDADGDGRLDPGPIGRGGKDAAEPIPEVVDTADLDVFAIRVFPSVPACEAIEAKEARWRVDRRRAGRIAVTGSKDRCFADVGVRGQGRHTVVVSWPNGAERAAANVEDRLVVAIGDSVAAGQGNPEGARRGGWLDPPCYRSSLAGFEQTARMFAQQAERDGSGGSITFVSLACSGAEVDAGLLEAQGVSDYAAQVDRLEALARSRAPRSDGEPAVDAVLVSVGGNDIGFSSVVGDCARPGSCAERRADAVAAELATMPERYDRLRLGLAEAAPGSPVLITEYFDPTHDERGEFCTSALGAMSQAEARWAYESVLAPLNAAIESAARENGWSYVGGIAADFRQHGYCAPEGKRWVRRLGESLAGQKNHLGTMHPNRPGHEAIAARVAPALAATLDLPVPDPVSAEDEGETDWELLAWILIAPFLPAIALLLILLVLRALRLLRPTWPQDPLPESAPGEPALSEPAGADRLAKGRWRVLWLALLAAAVLLALFLLSELAGLLIILARFWSANLPPAQAADAVGASELAVRGSGAIGLFAALGLAAVGVAWLLDGRGRPGRRSRRGLVAIGLAELTLAVQLGDFPADQKLEILAGLLLAGLLLYFLVERALAVADGIESGREETGESFGKVAWTRFWDWAGRARAEVGNPLKAVWRALPFALLALAIFKACSAHGPDRVLFVVAPYLLAVLLFAAPGSLASPGLSARREGFASLRTPRVALALTGLACILIVLVRDEAWLAASAALATVLGLLCLAIARTPPQRFAPYGIAILFSTLAFGAATGILRGIDSPELQPAAALLRGDRGAVCGAYVGESDGRLWLARLRLDDRADVRRPRPGTIFSIDATRVASTAIGPLMPVARVETRAAEMRSAMLAEGGMEDPRRGLPGCGPLPEEVGATVLVGDAPSERELQELAALRELAIEHQPELVIDRRDGFWPVSVRTLFSMQDRRASICRRVAVESSGCLRLRSPADLPWTGGRGEYLEYPAANEDRDEQHDLMVDALSSADPERTSLIYYLVSGAGEGESGPITIQYWFFYPFNYQPIPGIGGGYHEGDFESVAILFSRKTHRPRQVWMARHGRAEGRLFAWNDPALAKVGGDHPQIYVARGSHASYESCERQRRSQAPAGLIDDHPACDAGRPLRLPPETTPLADLSRAGWACWEGLFGHGSEGIYKQLHLIGDAPRSPLWQQDLGGERREPCRGVPDPGGRYLPGEEVLTESTAVPASLREGSGSLLPMVDSCEDWRRAVPRGVYMVACDEGTLATYLDSGLERVPTTGVRIEEARREPPDVAPEIPAQRQDASVQYLEGWRIVAGEPAVVTVYASCPYGGKDGGVAWVEFKDVEVRPGRRLRLFDRGRGGTWSLADQHGAVVKEARPHQTVAREGRLEIVKAPSKTELTCGT